MIVILFVLAGAVLRLWGLSEPSYWMDEGFSIATAQALWQGDWLVRSPLYHLLLAVVGWVTDWNIVTLRGLSVVIGVGFIALGFYTSKYWFNKTVAIVLAGLLTSSTLEIAWARQIRMYILLQFFFWLSLYCYQQWRAGKIHWVWPLLTTVATIGAHEFGIYLLVVYLWYEVLQRNRRPLLFILFSLVSIYVFSHVVSSTLPYINYWWHYLYFIGTEYNMLIVLALCGVYAVQKKYQLLVQWLVVIWFGWLFCVSFIVPLLQYRYLFMTFPIMLLLSASGAVWLWQQRWIGKLVLGICIGVLIWQQQLTIIPQSFYPLESDPTTAPFAYKTFTPQPNFSAAYEFLRNDPTTAMATPYPIIHKLYTHELPDYTLFVNLTGGTYPTIPELETYTQRPYNDPSQLPDDQVVILLIDQFAEYRLDEQWKDVIVQAELIWEDDNPLAWSSLRIYRIVPL